jgi:LruC domain-containing protein
MSFINTTDGDPKDPVWEIFSIGKGIPMSKFVEQIHVYDKTKDNYIRLSNSGEDPHAIIIPGDVAYPKENACIKDAYPEFMDWVQNAKAKPYWYKTPMDELVYKAN